MRITVSGREYHFTEADLTNADLIALEDYTGGWGLVTFNQKVIEGSGRALTFLVWLVRSRQEPRLALDEVSFSLDDLKIELDDDEDQGQDPDSGAEGKDQAPAAATSTGI